MSERLQEQFRSSMTENFFQEWTTMDVFDKYEIVEKIRDGEFGLYKVKPKDPLSSVRVYSLKTFHLNRLSRQDLHQETIKKDITALKALDHPNILKLYEIFYNETDVHMIQEYINGDDLYSRSPYSEREAARISFQLASAVAHMHEVGVIHRDLGFENIRFEHNGPGADIKVTDFGVAKRVPSLAAFRIHESGGGSNYTLAPEVIEGEYTQMSDCWSMGVVIYMLLSAQLPFYAKRSKNMMTQIMHARYKMSGPVWDTISNGAKHLVKNLLVVDPNKRMSAAAVLDHIWIRKCIERCSDDAAPVSDEMLEAVGDSLQQYRNTTTLKKLALNIMAHKSTTQEIIALRKVFDLVDKSHNGTVDFQEFKEGLKRSRFAEEDLAQIFDSIDVDKSGQIQYTEFLAATLEARGYLEEERIAEAFQSIDRDGSGFIDKDKLKEILGETCTSEQVDEMIRAADKNNDGLISYDEFFDVFRDQTMILAAQVGELDETTLSYDDDDDFDGLDFEFDPNGNM